MALAALFPHSGNSMPNGCSVPHVEHVMRDAFASCGRSAGGMPQSVGRGEHGVKRRTGAPGWEPVSRDGQ
jgi:hypothetical protein